jgi:hypothetical protein
LDSFISFSKKYEKKNPIIWFLWCWTLSLRPFLLCIHLMIIKQGKAIVEEYDKIFVSNIFLNVIIICIFCLNLKRVSLIKRLKRITIWISLKWQPTQVNPQQNWSIKSFWFWGIINWILKASNVHYNGEKNMKACFLKLVFV